MRRRMEVEERRVRERLPAIVVGIDEDASLPVFAPLDAILLAQRLKAVGRGPADEPGCLPVGILVEAARAGRSYALRQIASLVPSRQLHFRHEPALESPVERLE